jgi:Big-like domain-containing protein
MRLHHSLLLVSALLGIAGCPTRNKYSDTPSVRITSPGMDPMYTNGTVRITAALDPTLDLPIVVLDNGIHLTTLTGPSYSYDWITSGVNEGEHVIVAEVAFSNETARSAPVTIVVDRTPPTVSRTPAPGARNVALRSPIRAAFSEPIVLTQPAAEAFSLSVIGGSKVASHVSLDPQSQTATIGIDDVNGVSLPTSLLATIAPTIADRAGNPLTLPSNDWLWDVPDFIKFPAMPICAKMPVFFMQVPAFAVGSDLMPVLIWAASTNLADGEHCQLQLSKYDGAQWIQVLPPVSDDLDSALLGASLAIDRDNRPFVAWRPYPGTLPGEIDVASWSGTAWDIVPPILPQPGVQFPVVYPLLRVGQDGRPVVLWGAGTGADRYFIARRTETAWNEDFGLIPIVTPLPFDGTHFDMVLNEAGNPIVAWLNPVGTGHVSTWDGKVWSPTLDLEEMTEPFLALDSNWSPMVVTGGSGTFFVQHLVNSSWRLLPAAVGAPPQARHTRIAAGPDGLPILGWYDGQTTGVGMARWTGQHWDTRAFSFGPNAVDEAPQVVVDQQGTAWIGWRDRAGQFNLWMSNY